MKKILTLVVALAALASIAFAETKVETPKAGSTLAKVETTVPVKPAKVKKAKKAVKPVVKVEAPKAK